MKALPVDLAATWQPECESLLPSVKDLAAIPALLALCALVASAAILFT